MKNILLILVIIVLSLIITLFIIRLVLPKEIDDVSPELPCSTEYLSKSDILWVIPKFNNKSISESKDWCKHILSLNKTLGLHGKIHSYKEFEKDKDQMYLEESINIFEQCFGFKPTMFKPPQLKISPNNKQLIKKNNMILKKKINQISHKVYHCNNTGLFSNKFIDFI